MGDSGGYIDKLDNGWEVYGVGQDLFGTWKIGREIFVCQMSMSDSILVWTFRKLRNILKDRVQRQVTEVQIMFMPW